ncbi:portal protein [Virgisporangium aliadipatigenens]|uniref:Portal protein n=1 Tax=Virgisporangium aliadipatigenens TaxID=741659 RepID=A0A8J4DWP4_9ACTN|nr:phage portal protein [Virgisporangium aliadipatigenens]GIJ51312.1 portal protein [Virgisporangium aliadipatigenens]
MTLFSDFLESRVSPNDPTVPLTADSLMSYVYGDAAGDAGVVVTPQSSMRMSAVWRCVAVTAGVSSALPLHVYADGSKKRLKEPLLAEPHPELTRLELWRLTYVHRLLWGNGYLQKVRNRVGQVVELWPVRPWRVTPGRVKPRSSNPSGKVFAVVDDEGRTQDLTSREILHLPHLSIDGTEGLSPIGAARQAVGLAQAAEASGSRFFGRGAQLSGVLQVEQRLTKDQAEALQNRWEARHSGTGNAHKIAVLDSNAKFAPITMPLRDAQFLETRQFQVPEIARFFGVPLFLLFETAKSTSWGTGLEQQAQGWVVFDLQPTWLAPTEQRISKELLIPGREARYNVDGLLRGDSAARAAFYNVMRQVGAYSANDIRDRENLPPVEGGEVYLQPMNMVPLGTEPPADPEPAEPPVDDEPDDQDDEEDGDDDD